MIFKNNNCFQAEATWGLSIPIILIENKRPQIYQGTRFVKEMLTEI